MSLIQQASALFHDEPDHLDRVCLLDQDGFIVAKAMRRSDAKWVIAAKRETEEKAKAAKFRPKTHMD